MTLSWNLENGAAFLSGRGFVGASSYGVVMAAASMREVRPWRGGGGNRPIFIFYLHRGGMVMVYVPWHKRSGIKCGGVENMI